MVLYGNLRSSINSFTKPFLTDSDETGTRTNVNVSTPAFNFSAERKPSGKTSANVRLSDAIRIAGRSYKFASNIKTGDVQEIEVSTPITDEFAVRFGGIAKKRVMNAEGTVTDNAGASLGLTFQNQNCGFTLDTKYVHEKDCQVELTGAGVYRDFTFGGKTKFNVQAPDFASAYRNLEVGARGDFGKHSSYVTFSDEFNKISGAVEYRIPNSSDRVIAESEYVLNKEGNNNVKLSVGMQKVLPSGATAGIRLSNNYRVGVTYRAKLNSQLTATVAADVDTMDSFTSKVGVNLDFSL